MSGCAAFTCITCQVAFADADLQRNHYKTDWHRYNLKRKVANLPPVTAEGFNQRVLAQRAQVASDEAKETSFYCQPCSKKISSEAAYHNHIISAKHKQQVLRSEEQRSKQKTAATEREDKSSDATKKGSNFSGLAAVAMDTGEELDSDEEWDEDVIGIEECLFCRKISKSLTSNVKHMTGEHNFYIPDIEYLVDLEGLVTYLGEKVGQGKMCLWCNNRSKVFRTVKATQQHMVDKGHCMLLFEGDALAEYADYYDYSSSYPDGEMADPDSEVEADVLEADDEYQLMLPSGAKVGHRALCRYYKQNLVSRAHPEGKSILKKVMGHYKALGWTGATGALVEKRVKDLQYMQRSRQRHWQKLGVKANKTSQPNFRPQVVF